MQLLWPLLCFPVVLATVGHPPVITYFDGNDKMNQCATRLQRRITGSSGVIYSHAFYGRRPYNASRNCFMMIVAPTGYRIRLKSLKFDVNGHISNCDKDTLHVFDHETPIDPKSDHPSSLSSLEDSTPGPIIGQFCGHMSNQSTISMSSHNALTLWWHSNPNLPSGHQAEGFELLWSAYRTSNTGVCSPTREFSCGDNECIPIELACDHYADCKDGTDLLAESRRIAKCENVDLDPITNLSGGYILLLSGGLVFTSLCFCAALCFCCKSCRSDQPPLKGVDGNGVYAPPEPPQFFPPSPPKVVTHSATNHTPRRQLRFDPNVNDSSLYRTVRVSNEYGSPLDMTQNEYSYVGNDAQRNLL